MRQKIFVLGMLLTLALAGGALIHGSLQRGAAGQVDPALLGTLLPEPRKLSGFLLGDHAGQPFAPEQLEGQWSLLFFGYTSCPDICPTTLSLLSQTVSRMQEQKLIVPRVVLVSVDPARDDAVKLGQYVGYFGAEVIGVSGARDQLDLLARQIGAVYELGSPDAQGNYEVAHSASVFVVDPKGRLYAVFSPPHESAAMVRKLVGIQQHFEKG